MKCTFESLNDGTLRITKVIDSDYSDSTILGFYKFPEEINGKKVTRIGDEVFSHFPIIKGEYRKGSVPTHKVIVPEGIINIEKNAFKCCYNLTEVQLPQSLNVIGESAFSGCNNLNNIIIPENVEEINDGAFLGCVSLNHISISPKNNVFTIVDGVLFNKIKKSVVWFPPYRKGDYSIPVGILKIDGYAFAATQAEKIIIPDSVLEIGQFAFSDISHFYELVLNSETSKLKKIGRFAFSLGNGSTANKWGKIPFSFTLPVSLEEMGENPFRGTFIARIQVCEGNPYFTSVDGGVLFSSDLSELIAFPRCRLWSKYEIPKSTISIADHAFELCDNIVEVFFPEGLQKIGKRAFSECSKLKKISLPNTMKRIEERCFQLTDLDIIDIPENIEFVENQAFGGIYHPHTVIVRGKETKFNANSLSTYKGVNLMKVLPDSPAEKFAEENNIPFEYLSEEKKDPFDWL